jgi:hypothetical protein
MHFFYDKVVLWCWAIAALSAVLSTTLAPWFMRLVQQKRGVAVSSRRRRVAACFLAGAAFPIGLFLLFGLLAHPVLLIPGAGGAVILFSLMGKEPRLPIWGRHLGVILLCNLIYAAGSTVALNRGRELGKRSVDGMSLMSIWRAMMLYRDGNGVFPDDLRRLVDAGQTPFVLVPLSAERPKQFPESRPYSGPCDFTYVRLPENAPEGLVWVWESPKYHKNEGTWVLYTWGPVRWVTPEKLEEDLRSTQACVDAQAQSVPATAASEASSQE